ncbi:MAG TPA: molybdate-binding protein, partial [Mycobacterium sp.]|nr:molybdate-binding protein [Mycobacterium sp.]
MKHAIRIAAAAVLLLAMVTGCGSSDEGTSSSSTSSTEDGKLIAFAAASLKKSFTEIGEQFKTDNPGTVVE